MLGVPRRVYMYPAGMGWDTLNLLSSLGSVVLAFGILVVVDAMRSMRSGRVAGPDPWAGPGLEWATASPRPCTTSLTCRWFRPGSAAGR